MGTTLLNHWQPVTPTVMGKSSFDLGHLRGNCDLVESRKKGSDPSRASQVEVLSNFKNLIGVLLNVT